MAIKLNKEGLTPQQIEMAGPIERSIASYDRKISENQWLLALDPVMEYEKEKRVRDKIAGFQTKKAELLKQLNDILDARNIFNEKFQECANTIKELEQMKKKYGF